MGQRASSLKRGKVSVWGEGATFAKEEKMALYASSKLKRWPPVRFQATHGEASNSSFSSTAAESLHPKALRGRPLDFGQTGATVEEGKRVFLCESIGFLAPRAESGASFSLLGGATKLNKSRKEGALNGSPVFHCTGSSSALAFSLQLVVPARRRGANARKLLPSCHLRFAQLP